MTYLKPQVEIVKFDFAGFMTTSTFASASDVLNNSNYCATYNGGPTNNFQCTGFGGAQNPSNGTTVNVGGYTFVSRGNNKGQHWQLQ